MVRGTVRAWGLLSEQFTRDLDLPLLSTIAWRAVWLHAALTGPVADVRAPRDREALALVATSPFGVGAAAGAAHLRRLGVSTDAATHVFRALASRGLLSVTDERFDLPVTDLHWITCHLPVTER